MRGARAAAAALLPLPLLAAVPRCPPPPSPPFPPPAALARCDAFPDPWLRADGTRAASRDAWAEHRREMIALLEHYMMGAGPAGAAELRGVRTGTADLGYATLHNYTLSVGPNATAVRDFELLLHVPAPPLTGPFPAFVFNSGTYGKGGSCVDDQDISAAQKEILVSRGYVLAQFNRDHLRTDARTGVSGRTPEGVQLLYPEYPEWGTIAVWAWGGQRVADFLLSDPAVSPLVDPAKLMAMGHSRGGKAALWQAAADERVSAAFPLMSGEGGCGALRVRTDFETETVWALTALFPYWFSPRFAQFGSPLEDVANRSSWAELRAPWDQHWQRALVAPRAQVGFNGLRNPHENPRGSQATYAAAREVYAWLGVPERIGIHFHSGKHPMEDADYAAMADFADFVHFGKAPRNASEFAMTPYDVPPPYDWAPPGTAGGAVGGGGE